MTGRRKDGKPGRKTLLLALLIPVFPSSRLPAQCPDGSPPPCVARATRSALATPANSVAVLSFENRTHDTTDSFLSDGLADEIAAQLGGVERLTVRSRTVVRRLRGSESMSVPDLGRALGAAYLVNGSIQRAGAQLRVQVELLRSATGEQAWAQRFDQAGTDLFQVQSDVATAVSQAIAGRLLPQEHAGLARRPTHSNEAYQLYLRAQAIRSRNEPTLTALAPLERALALDSTFAEAWALLSQIRMIEYFRGTDHTAVNLALGRAAAERARALAPDIAETHLAAGYVQYWGFRDYAGALGEFGAALRLRPGDAETWVAMALIARRQGQLNEAVQYGLHALAIDPANLGNISLMVENYQRLHRYDLAEAWTDSLQAHGAPAATVINARCLGAVLRADTAAGRFSCGQARALAGTDFARGAGIGSIALLFDTAARGWVDRLVRPDTALLTPYYELLSTRWEIVGDSARWRLYADSARLRRVAQLARDSTLSDARMDLADLLSILGQHAAALREVERAIAEMPVSRDALVGTDYVMEKGIVLMRAGRLDEALDIFERAQREPSQFSAASFLLFPDAAPLRGNPRFERLVRGQ
jgi:TolB-like protein